MSKKQNHGNGAKPPEKDVKDAAVKEAVAETAHSAEEAAVEAADETMDEAEKIAREYAAYVPKKTEGASGGGISFGGGANNTFIREFAESPRYKRTLEEIEVEEKLRGEGAAEDLRRRVPPRESAPRGAYAASKNVPAYRISAAEDRKPSDDYTRAIDTGALKASQRSAARVQRNSFVMPLSDMEEEDLYAPEEARAAEEPSAPAVPEFPDNRKGRKARKKYLKEQKKLAKQQKVTRFSRAFSQARGFGVLMLLTVALNLFFSFGYLITDVARTSLFTSAETAMAAQNVAVYSVTFTSPLIGVLKVVMFLLPVFDLLFTLKFRKTDKKQIPYNRKTVIVCLCAIGLGLAVAIFDVAGAHLLQ